MPRCLEGKKKEVQYTTPEFYEMQKKKNAEENARVVQGRTRRERGRDAQQLWRARHLVVRQKTASGCAASITITTRTMYRPRVQTTHG